MEKAPIEVVTEMKEWYIGATDSKAQEIADYVSVIAESAPLVSRIELFTQGVLFGYFLTTRGYIT